MKKRLLCLGLVAAVSQLFSTGCIGHPVARFRANHPFPACGSCSPCSAPVCSAPAFSSPIVHPLLHPVLTRRAVLSGDIGAPATTPACHGCSTGISSPVNFSTAPVATNGSHPNIGGHPTIGYPTPLTPGPKVVPDKGVPNPMPQLK